LQPLLRANPGALLIAPRSIRELAAERARVEPVAVGEDDVVELGPFRLRPLPAAHEQLERDERGDPRFLAFVVEAGPLRLFHAGDRLDSPALAGRLRPLALDRALLPINGRDPARGVAGNLDGPEAARLAHAARVGLAVPMHYDMFEFNTASPAEF